jgi:hypothetical protein
MVDRDQKKRNTTRLPARPAPRPDPEPPESSPDTLRWERASAVDLEALPEAGTDALRAANKTIELVVVDEAQVPGSERKPWRAAEIWTKRRVYGLDSTFKCFEILDRATGRPEIGHEMLGARLGGGRQRENETVRFSYPLPLPGMEAMFVRGKKHGYTSAVERMIVRIRVLHTSVHEAPPTWEEIASRWSEPPREG